MNEIKKLVGTENLVIGTDKVLKLLKKGELEVIYTSSNCSPDIKKSLEHYSALSGVKIEEMEITNEDVGTLVKKPFSVSVLAKKK